MAEVKEVKKGYLTKEEFTHIMALAWKCPEFKDAYEKNPLTAIKELKKDTVDCPDSNSDPDLVKMLKTEIHDFNFTYIIRLPERPLYLDSEKIQKIADGDEDLKAIAIPYSCCC